MWMRQLKSLLVFTLIFTLTACAKLPISEWLSHIDGETIQGDEAPQANDDAKGDMDGQGDQKDDIDKEMDTESKDDAESEDDVMPEDEVYREDDEENKSEEDDIDQDVEQGNEEQGDDIDSGQSQGGNNGNAESEEGLTVIQTFNTQLPENIPLELKYDKYPVGYDYLLILKSANIRELPTVDSKIVGKRGAMERISLVAEVKGDHLEEWDGDSWYQVEWEEDGETKSGFIFSALAEVRQFQFNTMMESIEELEGSAAFGALAHISNYKNKNGAPPKFEGRTTDSFGHRRSQSAAGYERPDKSSKFRYIPDGMLVQVLEKKDGFSKVKVIGFEGEYWVLDKYIDTKKLLTKPNKVIIVDRKYQNQGVFELIDGQWTLISYGLSTTGKKGTYSLETPLGYYMAIEKRDRFLYFKDGTNEIAGYAPYAVRFSGGGYIHGVPVDYKTKDGKRIDPGMREYLHTIGTTPRSHMCIRNYTSQAQFIHSWTDIGETAFIVIE